MSETIEQKLMEIAYEWGIDDPQIVDDILALGEIDDWDGCHPCRHFVIEERDQ